MKTISAEQKQLIEDLSAEGTLGQLPIQMAEKDIHITDLLIALSRLRVEHDLFQDLKRGERTRHDTGIVLVFCGGTCLSKAHGLIERMSEDVDIKIILNPITLKGGQGHRARLGQLHNSVNTDIQKLGLEKAGQDTSRDQRRYTIKNFAYKSEYDQHAGLRPEVKLEMIHREPMLPTEKRSIGYLYEKVASRTASVTAEIECISVAETVAEKVLSLLRRCAWQWSGSQSIEPDDTLVRHIYDVHQIYQWDNKAFEPALAIFSKLVDVDRAEFKGQNPSFDEDPKKSMLETLARVGVDELLIKNYGQKLLPLIYSVTPPSYEEAFVSFEKVANQLLATL
jgi:predicted nucleotidyltransferase component of viral defense system